MSNRYGPRIVTDGLVLCLDAADRNSYPLSGDIWSDLSGSDNDGTLVSSPTFDVGNGGSFLFDGRTNYCNPGNLTDFFSSGSISHNLTVELFGKINSTDNSIIFGNQTIINERIYIARYGGYWDFGWGNYGWNVGITNGTRLLASQEWTHFVLTVSSGTASLYINGNFTISKVDTAVNLTGIACIGGYFYLTSLDTSVVRSNNVAFARFYNRTLSADEVRRNYNATKGRFGL